MNFALFLFAEFDFQNMNSQFCVVSFELETDQELQGLGTVTANTGRINLRQGLGPFNTPHGGIKSMEYQQEIVRYDDKVIIG